MFTIKAKPMSHFIFSDDNTKLSVEASTNIKCQTSFEANKNTKCQKCQQFDVYEVTTLRIAT